MAVLARDHSRSNQASAQSFRASSDPDQAPRSRLELHLVNPAFALSSLTPHELVQGCLSNTQCKGKDRLPYDQPDLQMPVQRRVSRTTCWVHSSHQMFVLVNQHTYVADRSSRARHDVFVSNPKNHAQVPGRPLQSRAWLTRGSRATTSSEVCASEWSVSARYGNGRFRDLLGVGA